MSQVVGSDEDVDQLQLSRVQDGLHEQLDLLFVELNDCLHLRQHSTCVQARTREDPRGFPRGFSRGPHRCAHVYRSCVPLGEGVLLEREQELWMIREGLDRACAGEGSLLLIEAPAGDGKTALVREARTAARSAGM